MNIGAWNWSSPYTYMGIRYVAFAGTASGLALVPTGNGIALNVSVGAGTTIAGSSLTGAGVVGVAGAIFGDSNGRDFNLGLPDFIPATSLPQFVLQSVPTPVNSQEVNDDSNPEYQQYVIDAGYNPGLFGFGNQGVYQTTPGLIYSAKENACLYMDYVTAVEMYEGRYLNIDQINMLTWKAVADRRLESDYTVDSAESVIKDTFQALGDYNMTGYVDYTVAGANFSVLRGVTVKELNENSLESYVDGTANYHFQLATPSGNLLYDSLGPGNFNFLSFPDMTRYIHFVKMNAGGV